MKWFFLAPETLYKLMDRKKNHNFTQKFCLTEPITPVLHIIWSKLALDLLLIKVNLELI